MTIDSFRGDYDFLSNFYSCPVEYDGLTYQNTEAAFQAAKCVDRNEREKFVSLSPGQAKKLGRKVDLREDWETVKIDVMRDVLKSKFSLNFELREKLIATNDVELIEGNHWNDRFWGVCRGSGENWLGKILMEERERIKKEVYAEALVKE